MVVECPRKCFHADVVPKTKRVDDMSTGKGKKEPAHQNANTHCLADALF